MENYLVFSWDWVRVVMVYSLTIFAVSTTIVILALKFLTPPKLKRIPTWLRWVLILPAAFLTGQLSETISQILFATIEVAINHHLTFKPGFEYLTWQAYSPIFFIIGGLKLAPSHRLRVFIALGGLKITVALLNIYSVIHLITEGGQWSRLDPTLNSPLWWNATVSILSICLLLGFGMLMAIREPKSQGSLSVAALE